jgi:hypothetical protein
MEPLKYRGYFNALNNPPKDDEWIEIFVSDWFKDHWAFYAFIALKRYKEDIAAINKLIQEMNWRDGDVYVELINHSDKLGEFYTKMNTDQYLTNSDILWHEKWEGALCPTE